MDKLGGEVHLALVVGPFEGGLGAHVDGLDLVLGQQPRDRHVEEVELPEDVGDVELVGDGVGPLLELLGLRPVGLAAERVEEELGVVAEEVEDVEGLRGDPPALVVHQHLLAQAYLVGLLRVLPHEEHQRHDRPHQSPHVGQVGVHLVEGPCVFGNFR